MKDILFIIKELIPVAKSLWAKLQAAKDKNEKNKIKASIISANADYINSVISD